MGGVPSTSGMNPHKNRDTPQSRSTRGSDPGFTLPSKVHVGPLGPRHGAAVPLQAQPPLPQQGAELEDLAVKPQATCSGFGSEDLW